MDVKKLALLVGALVIAVVTAIMAKNMFAGAGAPSSSRGGSSGGPEGARRQEGAPGRYDHRPRQLTFQPWPKELMQEAYYVEGKPDLDPRN